MKEGISNNGVDEQVPIELEKFPVTRDGEYAFRKTDKWEELYHRHKGLLRKTNRSVRPDGEPVTEEWLDEEAVKMADVQCKMLERQRASEEKQMENKKSRTLSAEARADLEKLAKSDHPGAAYAQQTLERFDRYAEEDKGN